MCGFDIVSSSKMETSKTTNKSSFCILTIFIVSLLLLLHSRSVASQEVENEREFDYNENGERGPSRWGSLRPEWRLCINGSMQSPIDLLNERVRISPNFTRLNTNYKPSNSTLKNRGHDIMLKWPGGAGTLEINGTQYVLKQAHWHTPSEHTINGRRFHLELHMVHESLNGKIAVIGILYRIGLPDVFLLSLEKFLVRMMDNSKKEISVGITDPNNIKIRREQYYRYTGSLTVPPCTQNVSWTIIRKVRTVTKRQIRLLRTVVHDESNTNARPLQPINNRFIDLFIPKNEKI